MRWASISAMSYQTETFLMCKSSIIAHLTTGTLGYRWWNSSSCLRVRGFHSRHPNYQGTTSRFEINSFSEFNESTFLSISIYNTFIVSILCFFVRQYSYLSPRFSTVLYMLQIMLVFIPIQLLMVIPRILYANGILRMREQSTTLRSQRLDFSELSGSKENSLHNCRSLSNGRNEESNKGSNKPRFDGPVMTRESIQEESVYKA